MDVVLIQPNMLCLPRKKFYWPIECYPPLGLGYIASSLRREGFSSHIIDGTALNLDEKQIAKETKKLSPHIVGIYTTSFNLGYVRNLVDKIKEMVGCLIVLGGPHVTFFPQSIVDLGADYGMVGEGEQNFTKFVENYLSGRKITTIGGLVWLRGKELRINPTKEIKNLDSLPFPARDLMPNERYFFPLLGRGITTMITSRGCPFDCLFCGNPHRKSYRERSAESSLKEMCEIVDQGFRYVDMKDDIFTLNRRRCLKMCKLIVQKEIEIRWGCETRADFVDPHLLRWMRKAGCTNIRFGIETGNERMRKILKGGNLTNWVIKKAVRCVKRAGIEVVGYFMFGHPGETLTDMRQTLSFALKLNPDYAEFNLSIPIPGSRLFELAVSEGKMREDVWSHAIVSDNVPVYVPDGVSLNVMERLRRMAVKRFNLRPAFVAKVLKRKVNVKSLPTILSVTLSILKSIC